jgi:hypothetical protein
MPQAEELIVGGGNARRARHARRVGACRQPHARRRRRPCRRVGLTRARRCTWRVRRRRRAQRREARGRTAHGTAQRAVSAR